MPIVTVAFSLPDETSEYEAARLGGTALALIAQIDTVCRNVAAHEEWPHAARLELAKSIREMIPAELLESAS